MQQRITPPKYLEELQKKMEWTSVCMQIRVFAVCFCPVLWGVCSLSNNVVYAETNKTQSPISDLLCVLCFQRQPFRFSFYFTAACVKCCVSAVKCLPILQCRADYRIRPDYHTVRLDFSKLLNKLLVKYPPNKGTL